MRKIHVVEVGARDGLQNECHPLTVAERFKLVASLAKAGLPTVEVGAFVSPKWVPQMANTDKLTKKVFAAQSKGRIPLKTKFTALVPNFYGMEQALRSNYSEVAIFGSVSEAFSKKNINCTVDESFLRFSQVLKVAAEKKVKVRGYLSMAFGCPYEGKINPSKVVSLIERLLNLGVYQVSVGDTIGVATPVQVNRLLDGLVKRQVPLKKVAMHFHDTRGTALANVYASLERGITTFDSSVGGLGGCPYAQGAAGNLATEDLVYMLHGMGYKTGIDLPQLIQIKSYIEKMVGRDLPSHVGRSGLPLPKTINSQI